MTKVVSFGEIMLRLSPPGFERFLQSPAFVATFGVQWYGPDEYTELTGQVLTRPGQAGPEMVLDIADLDGDGPYLIVGHVPAGKTYFAV